MFLLINVRNIIFSTLKTIKKISKSSLCRVPCDGCAKTQKNEQERHSGALFARPEKKDPQSHPQASARSVGLEKTGNTIQRVTLKDANFS